MQEELHLNDTEKQIVKYMTAKALLAAQVRKGTLNRECFEKIATRIDSAIEKIDKT